MITTISETDFENGVMMPYGSCRFDGDVTFDASGMQSAKIFGNLEINGSFKVINHKSLLNFEIDGDVRIDGNADVKNISINGDLICAGCFRSMASCNVCGSVLIHGTVICKNSMLIGCAAEFRSDIEINEILSASVSPRMCGRKNIISGIQVSNNKPFITASHSCTNALLPNKKRVNGMVTKICAFYPNDDKHDVMISYNNDRFVPLFEFERTKTGESMMPFINYLRATKNCG